MKLCKDCAHYRPAGAFSLFGVGTSWDRACMAPIQMHVEPVEGRKVYNVDAEPDPGKLRAEGGACGPNAEWFEPAPAPEPQPAEHGEDLDALRAERDALARNWNLEHPVRVGDPLPKPAAARSWWRRL